MKKTFKKCIMVLCFILGTTCIYATEPVDNVEKTYYENSIVSEPFTDYSLVREEKPATITPFNNYGESQVSTILPNTKKTVYVTPSGQPRDGYVGGSGAEVFFFETGGTSTKFTVKIDYKNIEFTAETGKTKSYGSGYGDEVPSKSGYYKFEFIKYYTIRTKKIDVYKYGEYKYTYYVYDPSYSLSHRWVRL